MSTAKSTRTSRRRGSKLRPALPAAGYVPFAVPEGAGGPEVLRAHLDWLLRNLDHLALSGHATLHTATAALHRDLLLLRMVDPVGTASAEALSPADLLDPEKNVFYSYCLRLRAQSQQISTRLVALVDSGQHRWKGISPQWDEFHAELKMLTRITCEFAETDRIMKQSTGR